MSVDATSLAATIRAWRDRLSPAAVGLRSGYSRRAVGLRREELAELAGMSVDYIVRLEQGRATTPSNQVVGALSRALQLSSEERDHLYRLAGLQPPTHAFVSEHIPPGMQRVLLRMGDAPVAVFAADWRLVWWNPSWAAVLGDASVVPPNARSLVRSRFPTENHRGRVSLWPVVAENSESSDRAIVADLRGASARYPEDPHLSALLNETLAGNSRFAQLWREAAVGHHGEDRKTIHHPAVGPITVDCDVLADSDTGLKIVIYTAVPGSEDETKLDLARVGGIVAPGAEHAQVGRAEPRTTPRE